MAIDNTTISDVNSLNGLVPTREPWRLHNVNAMKLWLDLNEVLQEYDLEGVRDVSELNSHLD